MKKIRMDGLCVLDVDLDEWQATVDKKTRVGFPATLRSDENGTKGNIRVGTELIGPLIIPLEGRSEFPDFGHLMSGRFLPVFGPLVSGS
jgi:hypothetical protein